MGTLAILQSSMRSKVILAVDLIVFAMHDQHIKRR